MMASQSTQRSPGSPSTPRETLQSKLKNYLRQQWQSWRFAILLFTLVVIPVKSSLADVNWVPTGSMNPTIVEGDMVYVNKLAYDLRLPLTLHSLKHIADPQAGDIAVLFSPDDSTRVVKRVIGTPGDEISMKDNVVHINGRPANYGELPPRAFRDLEEGMQRVAVFAEEQLGDHRHAVMGIPAIATDKRNFERITIPEGHYFVMGDNRDNSLDSRFYGLVPRKQFVGKAQGVVMSFNILDKFQPRLRRFFRSLDSW